ncbi:transposase, partial [Cytobacillus firmus]|nr:transposase [Cytobacillus firmus]MBG9542447.1 transposase [Cytobacillus firmus]MBG9552144.1 transposase [Cytobacillus firmus]MBG9552174.1 transposase [Cytobacillus firmus]
KYEVGLAFMGRQVDVVYDPANIEELTIEFEDHAPWKARKLIIGERAGKRPALPEHLQVQNVESSRLLKAAERKNEKRKSEQKTAVTFRGVWKEDDSLV